jgi:hypothetical protein
VLILSKQKITGEINNKEKKLMIKNLRPKLCEQGKIKIGRLGEERKTKDDKSTYRLPNKLDHFLITTTERDNTGNFIPNTYLMEQIAEMVNEPADHLTTIPVYLLFDDIDSNFYTTYNCYQGKTRICTGDGEKAVLLKTGEEITCPCPRLDQDYKGSTPCKPYGRLNVVLQCMDIIGGSWVYRTTGWNSVQDILGSLVLIKRVAGRLSGIPLMMKLFPKTTQLPRGPVTVYTVSLIFAGSALALAEEAKRCPMIGHDEELVPDQTIVAEEETEIQEEFFPPETEAERARADAGAMTEKARETKKEPEESAKKEKTEGREPTAADLAKKTKQAEDATSEKLEKTKATAAKKEKARIKKEQKEAKAAVAAAQTSGEEQQTEDTSGDAPPGEEPPIEEGEVLDEEPTDFGWV